LIKKLGDILIAISSGYEINFELFEQYCRETAKLYNWYRMPPSMHTILMHGSMVIKSALLPIEQLLEEAQKSRKNIFQISEKSYSKNIKIKIKY